MSLGYILLSLWSEALAQLPQLHLFVSHSLFWTELLVFSEGSRGGASALPRVGLILLILIPGFVL